MIDTIPNQTIPEFPLETKRDYTETLHVYWKKLLRKQVEVIINGTKVSGIVENVMASGGYPKRLIAIIKSNLGVYHCVYDLKSIEVITDAQEG